MAFEFSTGMAQLAYTAGIIDGEGCISIIKNTTYRHKLCRFYLSVSVGNTNEWLILWLKDAYGGSIVQTPPKKVQHKPVLSWRVSGKLAIEFLELIAPYLQLKKLQAEVAIKFQKRKKSGFKPNMVLEEADHILMASLNKRGVE